MTELLSTDRLDYFEAAVADAKKDSIHVLWALHYAEHMGPLLAHAAAQQARIAELEKVAEARWQLLDKAGTLAVQVYSSIGYHRRLTDDVRQAMGTQLYNDLARAHQSFMRAAGESGWVLEVQP